MNEGYIKIPRSLLNDPLWKSLPFTYRHVYLTILQYMAFKDCKQNDFGLLTEIKPGQILITERKLADLCDEEGIDKSLIHRALIKFKTLGFSNHKTNRKKTIITISRTDILELLEPRIESNSNQTRTIKEESEESEEAFSPEKEANKKKKSLAPCSPPLKSKLVIQEDLEVLKDWCLQSNLSISVKSLTTWIRKWDSTYVTEHLMLMCQRKVEKHERWMESALKNNYVGEEKRIENNKKFAEKICFEYGWSDLNITEKYCTDMLTKKDFQFNQREDLFQQRLLNEAKQKNQGVM